jgi:hypothetical protein
MCLRGELTGNVLTLPRYGAVQDRKRCTLSHEEIEAIGTLQHKLPAWAKATGLKLVSSDKEEAFTTVLRALARGVFSDVPPPWLHTKILAQDIEVTRGSDPAPNV